ncbi:MAG: aldehyde dehydrogenase family protein [Pseudomonadales bacterium]|nr:aldehyde dehydrogenase family protein [Pseudomonadales bacterium]
MNTFDVISPIDNQVYVTRPLADQQQIQSVLQQAQSAWLQWKATPLTQRQQLCSAMVDALVANKEEIAEQICWQMGRPIRYAQGEVNGLEERARHMIDIAPAALADITLPEKTGFHRYIKRESLGVVFVIAPWNYPYLTAINSIVPALLAGNCVLLKHSAQTPLCAEQLVAAAQSAGIPQGVFQYLHLTHQDTETLIANNAIAHVAFTGSVAGGQMVERAAAGTFKSVGLELGGKDPAYVRADADLAHGVETIVDGAFFNSGQSCCGIERAYVHESLFDDFVAQAVALIKQYQLGRSDDPATTLGPMVKGSAAQFARAQVQEALEMGAKAHISSELFPAEQLGAAYMAPQLLTQVNHSMAVMKEETFGPVLGVQAVKGDKEAIVLMNDSDFGLTASIFTQDEEQGVVLGEQLATGTVFVNRCDYLDPALAWTGVKHSGKGCTLSTVGYEQLTRPKSFHLKKV